MQELKNKIIREYNILVQGMFKGYKYNYKHILDEICFIEFKDYLDNPESLYEYYINL